MRSLMIACIAAVAIFTSACGGSSAITPASANAPAQIRSAAFSPQPGNSPEVTGYIADALAAHGVATRPAKLSPGYKSNDVDAIVSYLDVWRWDVAMYMQSIAIRLYNAKTGELLVSGSWSDSALHSFNRVDAIARDLINQMFSKLQFKPADEGGTPPSATPDNSPQATALTSQPAARSNKTNGIQVSKNEYTAREQARALQCNAQGILSTEGVGTLREEIVFDCGGGRKVTIVCRSGGGCG
ncbi:MAG: hypothetical protein HEQ34_14420 [Sphingorhabdus sp.]|uniref:hypothetical protein n=1 Tax=Sphingorhabdus sp. TaxID=1902408 RepID=UPI0025CCECAB|nr:hypothetical protein [Sphingorhabdus sp.]MCO4093122.1 hypothetical protein [Sphingorhabdus sp.]